LVLSASGPRASGFNTFAGAATAAERFGKTKDCFQKRTALASSADTARPELG
jgi:hypothetical protein